MVRSVLIAIVIAAVTGAGVVGCQRHWWPPRHEPAASQPAQAPSAPANR